MNHDQIGIPFDQKLASHGLNQNGSYARDSGSHANGGADFVHPFQGNGDEYERASHAPQVRYLHANARLLLPESVTETG